MRKCARRPSGRRNMDHEARVRGSDEKMRAAGGRGPLHPRGHGGHGSHGDWTAELGGVVRSVTGTTAEPGGVEGSVAGAGPGDGMDATVSTLGNIVETDAGSPVGMAGAMDWLVGAASVARPTACSAGTAFHNISCSRVTWGQTFSRQFGPTRSTMELRGRGGGIGPRTMTAPTSSASRPATANQVRGVAKERWWPSTSSTAVTVTGADVASDGPERDVSICRAGGRCRSSPLVSDESLEASDGDGGAGGVEHDVRHAWSGSGASATVCTSAVAISHKSSTARQTSVKIVV